MLRISALEPLKLSLVAALIFKNSKADLADQDIGFSCKQKMYRAKFDPLRCWALSTKFKHMQLLCRVCTEPRLNHNQWRAVTRQPQRKRLSPHPCFFSIHTISFVDGSFIHAMALRYSIQNPNARYRWLGHEAITLRPPLASTPSRTRVADASLRDISGPFSSCLYQWPILSSSICPVSCDEAAFMTL